jgi:hypothetical protein
VQVASKAANAFAASWIELRDFMQGAADYDRAQVAPRIQTITSSWQAYQTERDKAKTALSARQ